MFVIPPRFPVVIPVPACVHVLRKSVETGRHCRTATRLEETPLQTIDVERMAAKN